METAMNTFFCLLFGTSPWSFVWAQRRPGNPEPIGDGLHGASCDIIHLLLILTLPEYLAFYFRYQTLHYWRMYFHVVWIQWFRSIFQ